jgi:hypothetical protein
VVGRKEGFTHLPAREEIWLLTIDTQKGEKGGDLRRSRIKGLVYSIFPCWLASRPSASRRTDATPAGKGLNASEIASREEEYNEKETGCKDYFASVLFSVRQRSASVRPAVRMMLRWVSGLSVRLP